MFQLRGPPPPPLPSYALLIRMSTGMLHSMWSTLQNSHWYTISYRWAIPWQVFLDCHKSSFHHVRTNRHPCQSLNDSFRQILPDCIYNYTAIVMLRRTVLISIVLMHVTVLIHSFHSGIVSRPTVWRDSISSRLFAQEGQTKRPRRLSSINRKPRHYWSSIANVEREFRAFWLELNVKTPPKKPPTIPNQALLVHLGRNDLRSVIAKYGGREFLSEELGGADIMSGSWKVAVKETPELQQVFQYNPHLGLSPDSPPLSPIQIKEQLLQPIQISPQHKWKHRQDRKPRDYWNLTVVVQELYEYLDECQEQHNRPAVWMPQPVEIGQNGRHGLKQCLFRFGSPSKICKMCGLITHREWIYFEGQLNLLRGLKQYLDEYQNSDYNTFPIALEIQNNGYETLYALVQRFGGRRALASRFSMKSPTKGGCSRQGDYEGVFFGTFSITFAIDLLDFVRADLMKQKAPLKVASIRMPSKYKLETSGREDLVNQIEVFGGYENVARRLGLAYFV